MSGVKRWLTLVSVLLAVMAAGSERAAGQAATTTVQDTVYLADGTPAAGTVLVNWNGFTTASGEAIAAGNTSATIGPAGLLTIALVPNAQATPMGSYYTAVFHLSDGTMSRQYWVVPVVVAGGAPVTLAAIENQVLPTSVAMQTVSKAYVDNAIAAAATGFPTGTAPYVLQTGSTMTGPLVLPGDPVSPYQAADKNYVDENVTSIASGLGAKLSTVPTATQVVGQPSGTQLGVNHLNGGFYASQYVNTSGTGFNQSGIYNAFMDPSFAGGGTLFVDPAYSGNSYLDNNVGYGFPGDGQGFGVSSPVPNNTQVIDERDGNTSYFCSNPGANYNFSAPSTTGSFGGWYCDTKSYAFTAAPSTSISQDFGQYITFASSIPGLDLGIGAPAPTPSYEFGVSPWDLTSTSNTAGINDFMSWQANVYNYNGDVNLLNLYGTIDTGSPSPSSEGMTGLRIYLNEGNQYTGTVASGTAGANALSLTCTGNCAVFGPFGDLVDLTYDVISTSGTFTSANNATATVTTTATLPVSLSATMQTAITDIPIVATIDTSKSETVNVATSTAIAVGQLIYVCDPQVSTLSEVVKATDVGTLAGGVQSVTAMFRHSHAANAQLYIGGLAGRVAVLSSDVHNGQLFAQEIMGSTTANTFIMGTPAYGSYGTFGASGAIKIYHAAKVMNANDPSVATVSGRYAVVADNDAFAAGDSVQESGWPVQNWNLEKFLPITNDPYGSVLFHDDVMGNSPDTYGNFTGWAEVKNGTGQPAGFFADLGGSFASGDIYNQDLANNGSFITVQGWPDASSSYNNIFNGPDVGSFLRYNHSGSNPDSIEAGNTFIADGALNVNPTDEGVTSTINGITNFGNNNNDHTDPTVTVSNLTGYNLPALRLAGTNGAGGGSYVTELALAGASGAGADWDFGVKNFDGGAADQDSVGLYLNGSSNPAWICFTAGSCQIANLTASTMTVGTLNATTINGGIAAGSINSGTIGAARLPVFGPSGTSHAVGAVPDPGATAGATRFLREDGTWDVPAGTGGSGGGGSPSGAAGGDLSGSYPNPTVSAVHATSGTINGAAIGATAPAAGAFTTLSAAGGVDTIDSTGDLSLYGGTVGFAQQAADPSCHGLTFNGSVTPTGQLGMVACNDGSNTIYFGIPTGGSYYFLVNNTAAATLTSGGFSVTGNLSAAQYLGPAAAPSGSCATNGAWVFSQDGHATFCGAGTWVTKL